MHSCTGREVFFVIPEYFLMEKISNSELVTNLIGGMGHHHGKGVFWESFFALIRLPCLFLYCVV